MHTKAVCWILDRSVLVKINKNKLPNHLLKYKLKSDKNMFRKGQLKIKLLIRCNNQRHQVQATMVKKYKKNTKFGHNNKWLSFQSLSKILVLAHSCRYFIVKKLVLRMYFLVCLVLTLHQTIVMKSHTKFICQTHKQSKFNLTSMKDKWSFKQRNSI